LTPGSLRAAIARAVIEVAPDKARKRREKAAKSARVEQWAEFSGNAALVGRELPPAEVLAVGQRIDAWAARLKEAGLAGTTDEVRARAFLDLLLGTDSRPGQPGGSAVPAGYAAKVNLTIPLSTLLDLADRPGEIGGIWPGDPWLAPGPAPAAPPDPSATCSLTRTAAPRARPRHP